jgi:hypothetical protein
VSCSSSAATSALGSTYLTWVIAVANAREPRVAAIGDGRLVALVFATVCVRQFDGRATRQTDVRPILKRIASLQRWPQSPCRNELVPTTCPRSSSRFRGNDLRDNATACCHGDSLTGFYAPDVAAQVLP